MHTSIRPLSYRRHAPTIAGTRPAAGPKPLSLCGSHRKAKERTGRASFPRPDERRLSIGAPVGEAYDAGRVPAARMARPMVVQMSASRIKLQILLRREWRTSGGIDEARKALIDAGLTVTNTGLVSISAELDQDRFRSLFDTSVTEIASQPPTDRDFGRSGGQASAPLKIPSSLERYIETISVAPGHIYFEK
jgi:hypothetical protein